MADRAGYQTQSVDTRLDAEIVQFSLLRQWTSADRLQLTAKLTRQLRAVCLAGIKRSVPHQSAADIRHRFDRAVLATKWSPAFKPTLTNEMTWIQDSIELAGQLHLLFESSAIPYYVGGGVASSAHGEPRATRDLDVVIQIEVDQIDRFIETLLIYGFYVPEGALEDLKQGRNRVLNITNMETSANADLFVMDGSPFAQSQMSRRVLLSVDDAQQFWICTPEDTILQKLLWRRTNASEQQWRDILGMLKLQGDILDFEYLWYWAEILAIQEDFTRACHESGQVP